MDAYVGVMSVLVTNAPRIRRFHRLDTRILRNTNIYKGLTPVLNSNMSIIRKTEALEFRHVSALRFLLNMVDTSVCNILIFMFNHQASYFGGNAFLIFIGMNFGFSCLTI